MIIEFELRDKYGNDAQLGSVIEYTLPEINNEDFGVLYLPGGIVTGKLHWRASRGLMIRVINGGETELKPGKYIPFRRNANPWRVIAVKDGEK